MRAGSDAQSAGGGRAGGTSSVERVGWLVARGALHSPSLAAAAAAAAAAARRVWRVRCDGSVAWLWRVLLDWCFELPSYRAPAEHTHILLPTGVAHFVDRSRLFFSFVFLPVCCSLPALKCVRVVLSRVHLRE